MTKTPNGQQGDRNLPAESGTDETRYNRGAQILAEVDKQGGRQIVDSLSDIAPDLAHHVVAFGFGDIFGDPGLAPKQRQLVTLGILAALGGCEPQLRFHVNIALNVGLEANEIVEAITQAAVYAGFPRALNAMTVAKEVFHERGLLPVRPSKEAE